EVRDDRIRILAATGMCEDAPTVDCPRLLAAEATPHSFPLVVRGRSLGALRIVMRGATEVSPAVRDLLGSLASHAAIALDCWRRLTGCEVAAAQSASEFTRGIEVHREERDQAVTGSEIARAALGGRGARDSSLDMLRVLERVLAVNGAALALVRGSSSDAAHDQLLLASSRSSDSADGLVVEWLAATGAAALLAGMELEAGSSIASMLSNPGVPYDVSGAAWTGVDRVEAIGGSIHGGLGDEIAAELDAISCENVLAMSLAAHEQIVGVVLVTLES